MSDRQYLFTSESVCKGHPDKVADHICDAVLDAVLAQDHRSRVACEALVKSGLVVVAGEITTTADVDYVETAREAIRAIGYNRPELGFSADSVAILTALSRQSPDIAMGVDADADRGKDQGAGDQGMMFGFACNETDSLMPLPIMLAHRIMQRAAQVREEGTLTFLRPDGKGQVTAQYEGNRPVRIKTIVLSLQHDPDVTREELTDALIEEVIRPCLPDDFAGDDINYHINPTGRFVVGGPEGDSGLSGRKIIVDTYGGRGRHGGGSFSGKDPSKVDRSAAYASRYVAKNIVAAGLAEICEVGLAYAIGVADPVSVLVSTEGTSRIPEDRIADLVRNHFDLRPRAIIETLNLMRPIYGPTASFGHFGREEPGFTWEKTDKAEALRADAGL